MITNTVMQELNDKIVEGCINYLTIASQGRIEPTDVIRMVAEVVQCSGGTIDACSHCGAMPMTAKCNNAGCHR